MPTGALDYTYYPAGCATPGCAAGKLASIVGPGTEALAFTYDGQLQKSATWSGLVNGSVGWTYDTDFRKITETVQAGATSVSAAFGYDADSLLTCASPTTCPSGAGALTITRNSQNALLTGTTLGSVTDSYGYNSYRELATYQAKYGASTLYSVTYDATGATRDALGRVVTKTETLQGTTHVFTYGYDVQGRLTDVSRDGSAIEHYGYDLNGNRTTATVGGTTVNPTYDDQDRLLTYGGTTFTYTANGELRTKTDSSGTTTYTYDAMGSLIAVSLPGGRLIEYITDGKNRRIGKMINGVLVKQWLYRDQLKPVAELDGSGNIVSQFIYGTKNNVPDSVVRGGSTYRIVTDQLGSPVLAINTTSSSDIPFQAIYSAWGERTLVTGAEDWMPLGFAGGIYDPDTKLARYGAQDYGATIGRWVSKDPIQFRGGSSDLYGYVLNDPVNLSDPWGQVVAYPDPNATPPGPIDNAGILRSLACSAVGMWLGIPGLGFVCNPPKIDTPPPRPCGDGEVPACVKGACDCIPPPPKPNMCFSNPDWNVE
jgi:RHS repeat-associated protein